MKKLIYALMVLLVIFVLSLLGADKIGKAKRKHLDIHQNRVQNISKWTEPVVLKKKAIVKLPEIEGSKRNVKTDVKTGSIRKVTGTTKRDSRNNKVNLQMLKPYNPAFELLKVKKLKSNALREITKEQRKINIAKKEILKKEDGIKIEKVKEIFYVDF